MLVVIFFFVKKCQKLHAVQETYLSTGCCYQRLNSLSLKIVRRVKPSKHSWCVYWWGRPSIGNSQPTSALHWYLFLFFQVQEPEPQPSEPASPPVSTTESSNTGKETTTPEELPAEELITGESRSLKAEVAPSDAEPRFIGGLKKKLCSVGLGLNVSLLTGEVRFSRVDIDDTVRTQGLGQ